MMAIRNVLLVHRICKDSLPTTNAKNADESGFELSRIVGHDLIGSLPEQSHLAQMRFGHTVALTNDSIACQYPRVTLSPVTYLESVLVSARLLAHLAVPPQLQKAFRLEIQTLFNVIEQYGHTCTLMRLAMAFGVINPSCFPPIAVRFAWIARESSTDPGHGLALPSDGRRACPVR